MSGRGYWIVATLLMAAVVHLSFVLFAPKLVMAERLDALAETAGSSSLKVLTRAETLRLIGEEDGALVHAVCVYDLSQGSMLVTALIPRSYWSISIYSASGDNFYSFNDRQADVERLELRLKPAAAQPVDEEAVETQAPEGDTLEVFPPDNRGVVVFRALAGEAPERAGVEAFLARSSCTPARG
ncbi:MAG: DUF1254 domain-containing protein [Parvibaculaceae bacterium]